jgi:hypothetical protein
MKENRSPSPDRSRPSFLLVSLASGQFSCLAPAVSASGSSPRARITPSVSDPLGALGAGDFWFALLHVSVLL